MKKIMITMAAVSAIAAASPAAAQYANGTSDARINELRMNLQQGVQTGRITRYEAVQLRERLRQLSQLERRYSRDGLSRGERDDLQQRIQSLRQQIRMANRNGDNRPRYDDDRDYRDGRACPPGLAKKNNGCLPPGQVGRDYDRDDRDRDGRYDRDDRYDRNGGDAARYGFRDTDRYVFRYENGRVLQIDRRSGNVVRTIDVRR